MSKIDPKIERYLASELTNSELALTPFVQWETLLVSSFVSKRVKQIIRSVSKVIAKKILLKATLTKKGETQWWHQDLYSDVDLEEMILEALNLSGARVKVQGIFSNIKEWVIQKKWLLFGIIAAGLVLALPQAPPIFFQGESIALTPMGHSMIALLIMLIVFFVTEAVPIGAVIGVVYAWLTFSGFMPNNGASLVSVFSHDAIFFILGALMIAQALMKYRFHKRALVFILHLVGTKTYSVVFGIVSFCALSAAFIAEHTIAALMLPVGIAIVESCGGYKKVPNLAKLLMLSIAFGSGIGGLGTPSGGGRNVIMMVFLKDITGQDISYAQWALMGMPLVLFLIPVTTFLLCKFFKPEVGDLSKASQSIQDEMKTSPMKGKDWLALSLFLVVLAMWIGMLHAGLGMSALLGVLFFLIFNVVSWQDLQKINWGVVLLYSAAIGMGVALRDSGAASWLGATLLTWTQSIFTEPSFLTITGVSAVIMSTLSQTMANGPAVASIGPILLESARLSSVNVVAVGVASAMASTFAFMLIVGAPPNAIVAGSGYVQARDFLKVGFVLFIVCLASLLATVAFYWIPILGLAEKVT